MRMQLKLKKQLRMSRKFTFLNPGLIQIRMVILCQQLRKKNNDWAIIKFEDANLKDTFGGLPIASYGEIDTYTNYIALGYPDDKGNKQTYSKGQGLISSTDYRYDLYSFVSGGMSGGPIIAFYEEFDDHINDYVPYSYVIGIISTQEPDIPNSGQCWTGSTKIKNYIINFMEDLSA